ncbi:major facilitator superfamily MFS_1 [Magnetococcus marinus MC-1]|uniref:Major facilitator superfamily MFS_1 n=1 Tax=Magnetococcus marinus (strain ATCC BAA-1437 / JCM 17883 / MC-1) TaxID=156889 RepID=A0L6M6_MAGMM|nr:MFS transporter [Magnetococcus marinus]ABK43619.1 major facilitator superfamily MFS_1 [Magnetococcus marinus MC-1]
MVKQLNRWAQSWGGWRSPEMLLLLFSAALPLAFSTWRALLNNYVVEQAGFDGVEIGLLQSLREVPGLFSFTAIFLLLVFREQRVALLMLAMTGLGTAMTPWFHSPEGLYFTTIVMSMGFHYFETMRQSLTLQWIDRERTPILLGRLAAVRAFGALVAFAGLYVVLTLLHWDYPPAYMLGGGLTMALALVGWWLFPQFPERVQQHRKLIVRKRYLLYYLLTFMSGARRQIFVVFAGFLMVERFHYGADQLTLLFLVNCIITLWLAPWVGRWVSRYGERTMLVLEYAGLIGVFAAYAMVQSHWVAAGLYVLDHLFFSMALALKSYFQKIADPADIAPTAGISFTINHIAAVVLPALLGVVWMESPSMVFWIGAAMAALSLLLATQVPRHETRVAEAAGVA